MFDDLLSFRSDSILFYMILEQRESKGQLSWLIPHNIMWLSVYELALVTSFFLFASDRAYLQRDLFAIADNTLVLDKVHDWGLFEHEKWALFHCSLLNSMSHYWDIFLLILGPCPKWNLIFGLFIVFMTWDIVYFIFAIIGVCNTPPRPLSLFPSLWFEIGTCERGELPQ